ncbi:MAG: molybdopterin molybdotransferase MoeA, partial [Gammaproteobacteria bacterium]
MVSKFTTGGCGGHHAKAMTLESALEAVLNSVSAVKETQNVGLMDALDRVLAQNVYSGVDVPGHTNSAMDGYALRCEDVQSPGDISLRIVGESFAGRPYAGRLNPGECVRIMTGAVVPELANAIIIQENTEQQGDVVKLKADCRKGDNIRPAGEDVKAGEMVLPAGRKLRPSDLGLLASIG